MGMVGGGEGAFIGSLHRIAANIDGQIELVCGAFSATPETCLTTGKSLYLDSDRCYPDYQTMFEMESQLPAGQRMDFVAIVTPNHLHFPIAKMALEHQFHVLSDKPATINLSQALALKSLVKSSRRLYALTQTYCGYPLVKHARHLLNEGHLGSIRKVVVEYSQGWLAENQVENKQAKWRLDASQSGLSCCMSDIGVHAANLIEYISGLKINRICADLNSIVEGRKLDDDGVVLLQFDSGAKGILMASQVAVGEENNLRLRIYGDKASIDWSQMEPNSLWLRTNNAPAQLIRTGVGDLSKSASLSIRTPAGHPEGYLEAFANIYHNFARQICAFEAGKIATNQVFDVPGIDEAIRGMAFIENVVKASKAETKWHDLQIFSQELGEK